MSRFKFSAANCRCQKKTGIEWYQIQPSLNRPQKLQLNYYAWKMGVLRSQWIYYLGNPSNFFILLFALLFTFSLFMHNCLFTTSVKPILSAVWIIFGRLSILKLILLAVSQFYVYVLGTYLHRLHKTRPWLNANKTCYQSLPNIIRTLKQMLHSVWPPVWPPVKKGFKVHKFPTYLIDSEKSFWWQMNYRVHRNCGSKCQKINSSHVSC